MKRILSFLLAIVIMLMTVPGFADDYESMISKAQSYREAGDTERALASYQLAERAQPERYDAYLGEADLLLKLGNHSEALEKVNTVLEKNPLVPEAWALKCKVDIAYEDALALETDQLYAEVCGADLHDVYPELGRVYFDAGNYVKAVDAFELTAISSLSDNQREMFRRALISAGQKENGISLGLMSATYRDSALDQAFDENRLALKKADLSEEILDYEIDESIWERLGSNVPEKPAEEFLKLIKDGTASLYSLSPVGNSGIYCVGTKLGLAMYNGTMHVIRPSDTRGVPDEYGNLECYSQKLTFGSIFGEEGVVYSHNGKYAAVYNFRRSIIYGHYVFDPILIDLSTGEMVLTAAYGTQHFKEIVGVVSTACFSLDDSYFYYLLYGHTTENRCALYRYNMKDMTTELCCSIPYPAFYPNLCEIEDGSLIIAADIDNISDDFSVVKLTDAKEGWVIEKYDYSMDPTIWHPRQLVYSSNSHYALLSGKIDTSSFNIPFMVLKPDEEGLGLDQFHAIDKASKKVVDINKSSLREAVQGAETVDALPYETIYKSVLSPDGFYVLMLAKDGLGNDHLYMVQLETLDLKEVRGVAPSSIPIGESAKYYQPIIEWNTETLIIITTEGIETYEFDY